MPDSLSPSEQRLLDARSDLLRPAFEPRHDITGEVARRTTQGLEALARGDYRMAVEWLEQASVGAPTDPHRVVILASLLEALRGVAEESVGPLAERIYRRARRLLKLTLPLARVHEQFLAHVLREAGLLAAKRGRRVRCRRLLDESLEVANRLGQEREAALTRSERATLGLLWGWPDGPQEDRQATRAEIRPGERRKTAPAVSGSGDYLALVQWSCRLANIQSAPLRMLEDGLRELLPATRVTVSPNPQEPVLLQVAEQGHVVVGTGRNCALLGAPVLVEGALQHLVLAERPLGMGPFDSHSVLLAQFLTGLAAAALENERYFVEQDLLRARLEESEVHFRGLFQGVDVGLALVDTQDRILEVNKSFSDLLAEPVEQLVGREFRDFLHPLDRSHEERRFRDLMEGRMRQYQTELRFLRQGTPAWAQLNTAPLPGFPRLTVRTLIDVSFARIKSLMELEEQERTWLAADLHDAPAQTAAALCFQLQAMYALQRTPELEEAVGVAERLSARLRELLSELSNPVLGGDTLSEALSLLVGDPLEVDPTPHDSLFYRLVQECLATVQGPHQVTLGSEEGHTTITVTHHGMLRNPSFLRQRCLLLGGELLTDDPAKVVMTLPF